MPNSIKTTYPKLLSLGKRLSKLHRVRENFNHDDKLVRDNLRLNLASLVAQIIIKLDFPNRSLEHFNNKLELFNQKHRSEFTAEYYLNRGWVRLIVGEVRIPQLVSSFIYKLPESNLESHQSALSDDELLALLFLKSYKADISLDIVGIIKKEELLKLLVSHGNYLSIDDCTAYGFLSEEQLNSNTYCWKTWQVGNLLYRLRNDISARLWFNLSSIQDKTNRLQKFLQLIQLSGLALGKINQYLSDQEQTEWSTLCYDFLISEVDLDNSSIEYIKSLFDCALTRSESIKNDFPNHKIKSTQASKIINEIQDWNWSRHDECVYEYSRLRQIYNALLTSITGDKPYLDDTPLINWLNDTKKPYLAYSSFHLITSEAVQYLPQLLLIDKDFVKLAFSKLSTFEINVDCLRNTSNLEPYTHEEIRKEEWQIKQSLWSSMFSILLELANKNDQIETHYASSLFDVVLLAAEDAYSGRSKINSHDDQKKIYESLLKQLTSFILCQDETIGQMMLGRVGLIRHSLKKFIQCINNFEIRHVSFIETRIGLIHLLLDISKMFKLCAHQTLDSNIIDVNKNIQSEIATKIYDHLLWFYTSTEMEHRAHNLEIINAPVRYGVSSFAFGSVEWQDVFLLLNTHQSKLLDSLYDKFKEALVFETQSDEGEFHEQNKNQKEKISFFLTSILIAHKNLKKLRTPDDISDGVCEKLETWIIELSIRHSKNLISESRIDIFDMQFSRMFSQDMYHQSIKSLLFECINFLDEDKLLKFVDQFFEGSVDINRALGAINKIQNQNAKAKIKKLIELISLDEFLDTVYTITEIENTMVNAVNSENNWDLAEPLLNKVKEHYIYRKINSFEIENLLDEVKLLLAFKKKDGECLDNYIQKSNSNSWERAYFYKALHLSYNEKSWDKAEGMLKQLVMQKPSTLKYQFHLFRVNQLNPSRTSAQKIASYSEWKRKSEEVADEDKVNRNFLFEVLDYSDGLSLIVLSTENYSKFDQIFNRLPPEFKFSEDTLEVVFKTLQNRGLHTIAYFFLDDARRYFNQIEYNPEILSELEHNYPNLKTKDELISLMSKLSSMPPNLIADVLPLSLNGQRRLDYFICNELIIAIKTMVEKVVATRNAHKQEDQYNDLVVAILRQRHAVWGWSIEDQTRMGESQTGINAGEVDVVICSSGKTIALVEALRLEGKNASIVKSHAKKTQSYNQQLDTYFMIIYFIGESDKFNSTWESYCKDFFDTDFQTNCMPCKATGFIDLNNKFDNVNGFKISKTVHGQQNKISYFHIMIDLSL